MFAGILFRWIRVNFYFKKAKIIHLQHKCKFLQHDLNFLKQKCYALHLQL